MIRSWIEDDFIKKFDTAWQNRNSSDPILKNEAWSIIHCSMSNGSLSNVRCHVARVVDDELLRQMWSDPSPSVQIAIIDRMKPREISLFLRSKNLPKKVVKYALTKFNDNRMVPRKFRSAYNRMLCQKILES